LGCGLEIKARSLLGSRYIRNLIEHKLMGNPAHSLQRVPQSRTDSQFALRTMFQQQTPGTAYLS
jgi:hypothetical protein